MPQFQDKFRLIANLGKYKVVKVNHGKMGLTFTIELPNNVTITGDLPVQADVKVGDLLTLYTEVLADALPSTPSIQ